MLEIKISVTAAANLLIYRMRREFDARKKLGFFSPGCELSNIPYKNLLEITESAIFDLIMLLPAEIFLKKNNLAPIIANAVRTLSKDIGREEFILYDIRSAEIIVNSVCRLFESSHRNKSYLNN